VRILHLLSHFYPEPVGGTEAYVAALAGEQIRRGYTVAVAAPSAGGQEYTHDGLRVIRYPVSAPERMLHDVSARLEAAASLGGVLDRESPNVLHLHDFTPAISQATVREARRRRIPTVFTYHMPPMSCPRGTLMRWGHVPCDGYIDVRRCTACRLQGRGAPLPLALGASAVPPSSGYRLRNVAQRLGVGALASASLRTLAQREATYTFWTELDRLVALSQWSADVLLINGVPATKIQLSRHGLSTVSPTAHQPPQRPADGQPLRLVSLGRVHTYKGWDILVRALRAAPDLPVELDLYGIVHGAESVAHLADIERLSRGDHRITLHGPVSNAEVAALLAQYDYLVVPSQWLETGPLVVLEAHAAGVPVIGSDLGGIAELVTDDVDGLLVPDPRSPQSWARVLQRVCADRELARRLRAGIRPPRTMAEVAGDMETAYRSLPKPDASKASAGVGL
jgi:glycosyltransferase involved in cell wall biosynthesis